MENKKLKRICVILSVVLAALLVVMMLIGVIRDAKLSESFENIANDYQKEEEKENDKGALSILGGEAKVLEELSNATVSIAPNVYSDNAEYALFSNRQITCKTPAKFSGSDNLLFYFEAKSESEICEVTISFYSSINSEEFSGVFNITPQRSAYYIPITGITDIHRTTFTVSKSSGGVEISSCTLLNNGEKATPAHLAGTFNIEEVKSVVSKNADVEIKGAVDTICDDKYLYVISNNTFTVLSLENPKNPRVIGQLEDIGQARRLEKVRDGLVAVACREYGVFLIDVTNPVSPKKLGHIDTLELASGLDVKGDYLFIASRYYGIEIYDISNPEKPKYVNYLRSDVQCERIDCVVYGDYLYAGVWDGKRVEIFDIKNLLDPRYLGFVDVQGTAYGLDIYKDKLIVSSGFHSTKNESKEISDIGYGTGNAVTVFDLKYPERPKFVSSTLADGRYYNVGTDYWNVRVSGDYAYYNDMHNGVYVYDLTDVKKLNRVCKMTLSYAVGTPNYKAAREGSVFSFDTSKMMQGCVNGVAVYNGYVYLVDSVGVHVMKFDKATHNKPSTEATFGVGKAPSERGYAMRYTDITKAKLEGQTFAVAQCGDYLFVGTTNGIEILDLDMKKVGFYETKDAVRDLRVVNSRLYTAESLSGVAIYEIDGKGLKKLGSYKTPKRSNRIGTSYQIGVSPDGKFIVTTCGLLDVVILNAAVPSNITIAESIDVGSVYYRNICQSPANKNALYVCHTNGVSEIIFNGGAYTYREISDLDKSLGVFTNLDESRVLSVADNGYYVLDISNGLKEDKISERVAINSVRLKGLPAINGDVMALTNPSTGNVALVDIKDVYKPSIIGIINVEGTCDMPFFASDGSVFVPSRYEGLIKLKYKK